MSTDIFPKRTIKKYTKEAAICMVTSFIVQKVQNKSFVDGLQRHFQEIANQDTQDQKVPV